VRVPPPCSKSQTDIDDITRSADAVVVVAKDGLTKRRRLALPSKSVRNVAISCVSSAQREDVFAAMAALRDNRVVDVDDDEADDSKSASEEDASAVTVGIFENQRFERGGGG
jgi:hypothetical protein